MPVAAAAMTLHDRPFLANSWNSSSKKVIMTPNAPHPALPMHLRSAADTFTSQDESSFASFDRQSSGSIAKRHFEMWPTPCAKPKIGQPRANVDLSDIQAQAVILEAQSKQDHEESQKLTGQYLRQMCDTKSVRVTHACEHCRQRKAKVRFFLFGPFTALRRRRSGS